MQKFPKPEFCQEVGCSHILIIKDLTLKLNFPSSFDLNNLTNSLAKEREYCKACYTVRFMNYAY